MIDLKTEELSAEELAEKYFKENKIVNNEDVDDDVEDDNDVDNDVEDDIDVDDDDNIDVDDDIDDDNIDVDDDIDDDIDDDNTEVDNDVDDIKSIDDSDKVNRNISFFEKINSLNNPDNLDIPDGKVPYRENGETKFTTIEEYNRKFHMGSDYTKKTQELSKQKKEFDKFKSIDIKDEDLALIKLLKEGKVSDAMKSIGKQYNLGSDDLLDSTVSLEDSDIKSYNINTDPFKQTMNTTPIADSFFNSIPENYVEPIKDHIGMLPDNIQNVIMNNNDLITLFSKDVASGAADKILGYINSKTSQYNEFDRHFLLTNEDNFFNLYKEGADTIFGSSATQTNNVQQQTTPKSTGSQLTNSDREIRNRLNSGGHSVRNNPQKSKKNENDVLDRIMNEEGFVDQYIKEKFNL